MPFALEDLDSNYGKELAQCAIVIAIVPVTAARLHVCAPL